MRHRIWFVLFSALFLCGHQASSGSSPTQSETPYAEIADRLKASGLREQYTYSLLQRITSTGPRLAGSQGAAAAVNPRELELGTIAMALWAYLVAEEGI